MPDKLRPTYLLEVTFYFFQINDISGGRDKKIRSSLTTVQQLVAFRQQDTLLSQTSANFNFNFWCHCSIYFFLVLESTAFKKRQ